jgi:hypothetical protein
MADFNIVPKISYVNSLISGKTLKDLKVPGGVLPYDPKPVSFGDMSKLEPSKVPAPAGLTTAAAGVELPAPEKVGGSGNSTQWRFSGGDIVLNVEITVYIIDDYAKLAPLFKVITEHEYLHVLDYQTLAKSGTRKLFADDRTLQPWLAGEPWTGDAFYTRAATAWSIEAKRLGNRRDSGAEYERHKQEIVKLAGRLSSR